MTKNADTYDLICVVTNDLTQERRMMRICETLGRKGWRVLLIGRKLSDSREVNSTFIDLHRVICTNNSGPLFYLEILFRFRSELKKLNFSRLLFVDLDTALLSKLIRKDQRQFIIDLHEYFEQVPELRKRPIVRKVWSMVGRWSIPRMDRIMTVSDSLAELFRSKYNREVTVLRNVPKRIITKKRSFSKPLQTVYLGVLNPGRGLKELIHALKIYPGIHLKIIGDGPLYNEIRQQAESMGNIHFVGAVDPENISNELQTAHYGWNLLDGRNQSYFYSLANKFFDYLAHAIPVITMDFPEYRKITDQFDCGVLVPNLERSSINSVLEKIENDPHRWSLLHDGSNKAKEIYNWEKEEKKVLSFFKH